MILRRVNDVDANVLWWEIAADFLCVCEGATEMSDCTLPSQVTCEKCGRKFKLTLTIEEIRPP